MFVATGFGTGYIPRAPGTFGTLVGIPFFLLLSPMNIAGYLLVISVLFGTGIFFCQVAENHFGGHDNKRIVWDEVVGYLVTMTAAPNGLVWVVVGFVLFRLFDILKPWPIGWVDRHIDGGIGVMLDDVVAGLMAMFCLQSINMFI